MPTDARDEQETHRGLWYFVANGPKETGSPLSAILYWKVWAVLIVMLGTLAISTIWFGQDAMMPTFIGWFGGITAMNIVEDD